MTAFCRFTIGSEGTSTRHMRYVSRRSAVRDGEDGVTFQNVPEHVTRSSSFGELRSSLESFAWTREESEEARARARGGAGKVRSHYRCILSFERDMATEGINRLVSEWLQAAFPKGVAVGFVHRNTAQTHVHVWLDARGTDGKKLDFRPKEWRQIGAKWERLYERETQRVLRIEERFKEKGRGEERGASRGAGGTPLGRPKGANETPRLTPGEQAARSCAGSREEAVRAVEELRAQLERMGRRERPRAERERKREEGGRRAEG